MRTAAALLLAAAVAACASAAPARTLSAPRFVVVASNLDQPVYVTAAPGEPGVLYAVELTGKVRVIDHGSVREQPFLDLTSEIDREPDTEEGFLSMAFDRGYATNRFVYVCYVALDRSIRVDRFTTDGTSVLPATRDELLRVPHPDFPSHFGGLLQTTPDHRLYVGIGDGGGIGDPNNHAQDPTSRLGKLLSLDLLRPSAGWRMVALGLRNPWRYSFDPPTGDLYIGDVGQGSWEEVDVVQPADSLLNMQWPIMEGKAPYEDGKFTPRTKQVAPVVVYSHLDGRCAIAGGYVYRGAAVPSMRGRYFYGDWCTGTVWTITVANGKASVPVVFPQKVPQLVSFGEDAAGELYAVALDGHVYELHA